MAIGQARHDGELIIDHRASPGIPQEMARSFGFDPKALGEGSLFETAVLGCCHCAGVQIKNPDRKRPRNFCFSCNRYICDLCAEVSKQPEYVHRSFSEISDMVMSGRYTLSGSSSAPVLTKV